MERNKFLRVIAVFMVIAAVLWQFAEMIIPAIIPNPPLPLIAKVKTAALGLLFLAIAYLGFLFFVPLTLKVITVGVLGYFAYSALNQAFGFFKGGGPSEPDGNVGPGK